MRTKEDVQGELIALLLAQIVDLTAMSKIELGNDVLDMIKDLQDEIEGCDTVAKLRKEHVIDEADIDRIPNSDKAPRSLSLINYEGSCLRAEHGLNGQIAIYDQYDYLCELLNSHYDLLDFMDGETTIVDSAGKEWYYPDEHKDAKPSASMVYYFINQIK